jgi:hypothetical protein
MSAGFSNDNGFEGSIGGLRSVGLADKHFRPIEIEAKRIKDQQKSNLSKASLFRPNR